MFRTLLWVTFFLIAAIYGIYAFATLDRRDDETRIRSMIADTVKAVQNRDLGGTIACLSRNYSDDAGLNYDRLRMLAAQGLRAEVEYTASADIFFVRIRRDSATVGLRATVRSASGDYLYLRDLTLHLRKEHTRHMGVVPTRVWRVVKVDNLGLDFE